MTGNHKSKVNPPSQGGSRLVNSTKTKGDFTPKQGKYKVIKKALFIVKADNFSKVQKPYK